jgi:serine/threonine protein phosphatase PrpC
MTLALETCTAEHIGDREEQQDRVALFAHPKRPGMLLAVLSDGMGGHSGGAMAAEQVLLAARNNFDAYGPAQPVREMLADAINDAHTAIRLTRYTSEQDPHSTACLLLMHGQRADWAHCGDSRIYHFRNGELLSASRDHSYVNDLVRQGLIGAAEGATHPHKNYLLSCLGEKEPPKIDFGHADNLVAGDCFLLCSDGVWSYCTDAELARMLAQQPPRAAAGMLIEQARKRAGGRGDNISVAIVRVVAQGGKSQGAIA